MANVNTVLDEQVTLELESIDRLYLNGYVPILQTPGQLLKFLVKQRGNRIASPALLGQLTRAWVGAVERFAEERSIALVRFEKGRRKEQVARPYLEAAEREGRFGVVMIGVAQERTYAFRSYHGKHASGPSFDYRRGAVFVNAYYFYICDRHFGPAFIKLSSYCPFAAKVWLNGHEWAKRRARAEGIAFEALDNGFAACAAPERLQTLCRALSAADVRRFFAYWMSVIPQPLTKEDRAAGYRHELSILQCELSLTHVFRRPLAGRAFFEQALAESLTLGRPHEVGLLFGRRVTRRTPGRFQTRIVTRGCEPTLKLHYKHSSIRQYFKAERALRTETTINDTYDFGLGRKLANLDALCEIGFAANRRLLQLQRTAQDCAPSAEALEAIVLRSSPDGLPAPGLRFGEPRVMALLRALCHWRHLTAGFSNRSLRELVAAELGCPYGARQMTYDLRRLRRKGLIERVPRRHRYMLTALGRRVASFFTKLHLRIVRPALTELDPGLPADSGRQRPLAQAWRRLDQAVDALVASAELAPQM